MKTALFLASLEDSNFWHALCWFAIMFWFRGSSMRANLATDYPRRYGVWVTSETLSICYGFQPFRFVSRASGNVQASLLNHVGKPKEKQSQKICISLNNLQAWFPSRSNSSHIYAICSTMEHRITEMTSGYRNEYGNSADNKTKISFCAGIIPVCFWDCMELIRFTVVHNKLWLQTSPVRLTSSVSTFPRPLLPSTVKNTNILQKVSMYSTEPTSRLVLHYTDEKNLELGAEA